jgi:hypothetical protein
MKNIPTILFLILYTTFSVGLNIVVHTCGGESEATLATITYEDPCGCSDESAADKCCTTVITTIQLDDTQKSSIAPEAEHLVALDAVSTEASFVYPAFVSEFKIDFLSSFSPPPPNNDLCISNSVFRI